MVHGCIRFRAKCFGGLGVIGINGEADTCTCGQLGRSHDNGLIQVCHQFGCKHLGAVGLQQVGNDDHELVATSARNRIRLANAHLKARGDNPEDLISDGMTVGVIDLFEIIHINEEHRDPCFIALRSLDGFREAIFQEASVGETRQRIVQREVIGVINLFLE